MSVCVPCRKLGIDREATAYDEGVPMCEDHASGNFIPTPADPARKEQTPMSEPLEVPVKKRRGRPPKSARPEPVNGRRKRGRRRKGLLDHVPSNIVETEIEFVSRDGKHTKPRPDFTRADDLDEMIAILHARLVKIQAAITALRALQ